MGKYEYSWDWNKYYRWLAEGRGQGTLGDYKPWLTVHDLPSLGIVSRVMGRTASGVRGIDLGEYNVVGAEVVNENTNVLIVTENGYGKKTHISEYRKTHRGSKGVKALNVTEKNGMLVSLLSVTGDEDLIIITSSGIIMRISLEQVSTLKRATQGVRLINLKENQTVSSVTVVEKEETITENSENTGSNEQITE